MKKRKSKSIQLLGQSGCRFDVNGMVIYVDPYLSNSVQELDAPDLSRLVPIPITPQEIVDADIVLFTHSHLDHCDPHTVPFVAQASPRCRFIGPRPVLDRLSDWGISPDRCALAEEMWIDIGSLIRLRAVPASHPTISRDCDGNLLAVGYILDLCDEKIYIAGDTNVDDEIIRTLKKFTPIKTALLPVNEHNYFRGLRGIVGNMSVRDAFMLAEEVGFDEVIPVHWDMFAVNSTSLEEILAVYNSMQLGFKLEIMNTSCISSEC